MGKHFVPQAYLRAFTHDGAFYAYDKQTRSHHRAFPPRHAQSRSMYSAETEKHLADEIEGPANVLMERLRTQPRTVFTQAERAVFAQYALTQMKRVPVWRDKSKQHLQSPEIVQQLRQDMAKWANSIPTTLTEAETARELDALVDEAIANADQTWMNNLHKGKAPNSLNYFLSLNWQFLLVDEPKLLTSDNPIYVSPLGADNGGDITWPLSPTLAMRMARAPLPGGSWIKASKTQARELNRRTVSAAKRFVYAAEQLSWHEELIFKSNLVLSQSL